jgi:hypothetical protein
VKLIFDENLPRAFALALSVLDRTPMYSIGHMAEIYGAGTKDPVWLSSNEEKEQIVVITRDIRIRRRAIERSAWTKGGKIVFFLSSGWSRHKFWDQAWLLIRWWPSIVEAAKAANPGDGFTVPWKEHPSHLQPLP